MQLAKWITSKENPYFAKSYVNRIWSYLTGVGIIEPVDDIRAGNPPTNPDLLDRLTKDFIDSNFDVRHLMKTICKIADLSALGRRRTSGTTDDDINYSHALARRLPAEVLYDAIHRVDRDRRRSCPACRRAPGRPRSSTARSICRAGSSTCSASRSARAPASASGRAA